MNAELETTKIKEAMDQIKRKREELEENIFKLVRDFSYNYVPVEEIRLEHINVTRVGDLHKRIEIYGVVAHLKFPE